MGFFTRQDAKAKVLGRSKSLPPEAAQMLGVTALRAINPNAVTPNMQPDGITPGVDALVLLDWPSRSDDLASRHCSGSLGAAYRIRIEGQHELVAWDYVCRTMPPDGRDATAMEIEAHRPDVEATISVCRPKVVYALGHRVLDWLSPGVGYSMATHRGRVFVAEVAGHVFWVVPAIPPRQAHKLFDTGDKRGSGDYIRKHTWLDIKREGAYGKPWREAVPRVLRPDKAELLRRYGCKIVETCSPAELLAFSAEASRTIFFDWEGINLRPYARGSRITSIAVSDGKRTLSMLVDHPEVPVPATTLGAFWEAFITLCTGRRVYAHNLQFDLEWALWGLGPQRGRRLLQRVGEWCCSEVGAFILDQREGKSLDYLSRIYFGLRLKELSPNRSWDQKGAVRELLEYGALDAGVGYGVAARQRSELIRLDRLSQFQYHMKRIPLLVRMQARGFPVCAETVAAFEVEYTAQRTELLAKIEADAHVVAYNETIPGSFLPSSPDSVLRLFRDHLGCRKALYRDDKWTTDAEALGALAQRFPLAGDILALRDVEKKLGTYIKRFSLGAPDSLVYPDGKLHSLFLSTRTVTRRLASVDPNAQNWPKRKGAEIRAVIRDPRGGWILVSIDLGQIEARALAILTLDPHVMRMFHDPDYDIHLVWAEKLAAAYPRVLSNRGFASVAKFRSAVKNEFIFPAFYGAGIKKIARLTGIPARVLYPLFEEFWEQFAAVKAWQKRQVKFYEEHGYIETRLGFRREGPLKYNMILNTEPQSIGSDLCVEAAVRMDNLALETGDDWWGPIGNIHDDLIYCIPESKLEEFTPVAVRNTIITPHEFAQVVPLTCDLETGRDWANMERRGSYRSDQL